MRILGICESKKIKQRTEESINRNGNYHKNIISRSFQMFTNASSWLNSIL